MVQAIQVLLIEDNRIEARRTQHWLKQANGSAFEVTWVETLNLGIARAAAGGIDLVLLDLNLPDSQGLQTFVTFHDQHPEVPVVVLTGEYDEAMGPSAVEKGAQDYLIKNQADSKSLSQVLHYALRRHRVHLEQLATERQQRQAEMAREVQLRMLPRHRPEVSGYDFCDYYKAADHVGGDYFSYWTLPDQRIAISIGDICGKGFSAALTMAELCSEVRHCLETSCSPHIMLSRLNRQFCERNTFITFTLCILDPHKHTLTVSNAGHMAPLRWTVSSQRVELLPILNSGLPLGIQTDEVYGSEVFDIQPGDLFLLCTDGITEVCGASTELYGQRQLTEALRRPSATVGLTIQSLIRDVEHFRGLKPQSDDMCVVCFARGAEVKPASALSMERAASRRLVVTSEFVESGCGKSYWMDGVGCEVHDRGTGAACNC